MKMPLTNIKNDWLLKMREGALSALRRIFGVTRGWEQLASIERNNYELGLEHLAKGNHVDAVMRFSMVTWLAPKRADGWAQLGKAYLGLGKKDRAARALKHALSLQPGHAEAASLLAGIAG